MSVPDAWGLKYHEVVGLCWLAYKGQGNVGNWSFPNVGSNWRVTRVIERGPFRAIVAQGSKTVLSFSGTDEGADWLDNVAQGVSGISGQYAYALGVAAANAADVVVGHSLGGGLASYVGVYGRRPTATINPAALNINIASGIAMIRNGGLVMNYVATGEALDLLDIAAPTMTRVGRIIRISSNGGWSPVARHLLPNLSGFVAPVRA